MKLIMSVTESRDHIEDKKIALLIQSHMDGSRQKHG